jgi:hypothetical protein
VLGGEDLLVGHAGQGVAREDALGCVTHVCVYMYAMVPLRMYVMHSCVSLAQVRPILFEKFLRPTGRAHARVLACRGCLDNAGRRYIDTQRYRQPLIHVRRTAARCTVTRIPSRAVCTHTPAHTCAMISALTCLPPLTSMHLPAQNMASALCNTRIVPKYAFHGPRRHQTSPCFARVCPQSIGTLQIS